MPASPIYSIFRVNNCDGLTVSLELHLSKAAVSKIRGCLGGKRRKSPYWFGGVYLGEGKERIGASVMVRRLRASTFRMNMEWFRVVTDPPPEFGKISELVNCLREPFGEKEADVYALFSYDKKRVASFFKPILIPKQDTIVDEIIGFTGVKRNPQGKLLYQLEVSHGKALKHRVRFTQTIKLSENLPLSLLGTASKISTLALRPREEA
jgi:hypothetical protein